MQPFISDLNFWHRFINYTAVYNECCKRALANGSRHVFAFAQSVIEEVNNLQCALIVSQERGVHSYYSVY